MRNHIEIDYIMVKENIAKTLLKKKMFEMMMTIMLDCST